MLKKDVVADIISAPKGTPIMLDTSRIFSENAEEREKPVYVAIETNRFYGRDPSDLIKNLPAIINATQAKGFARYPASKKPYREDVASFAAESQYDAVDRSENEFRRRESLRRPSNIPSRVAAQRDMYRRAGRTLSSFTRPIVEYQRRTPINTRRGRPRFQRENTGYNNSNRARNMERRRQESKQMFSSAWKSAKTVGRTGATGAKFLGSAASKVYTAATKRNRANTENGNENTNNSSQPSLLSKVGTSLVSGATTVGSVAATGAKAIGSAAATGVKAVSNLTRKNKTPRPGSVAAAATAVPNSTNRNKTQKKGLLSSLFSSEKPAPRPGSVAASA